MWVIFTLIILAGTIVFFCLDRAGRISRDGIGRMLAYLAVPLLLALIMCISAMSAASVIDLREAEFFTGDALANDRINASYFISLAAQALISVPALVVALVGCISAIKQENDRISDAFGIDGIFGARRLIKTSAFATVFGLAAAIAALVFTSITAVYATALFAVGIFEYMAVSLFLAVFTFGIGLIIMACLVPFYALFLGLGTVTVCVPYAISAFVWGAAFCVLHIFTVLFAVFAVRRLYKEEILTKKKAILSGIGSAVPVVNIFCIAYLFSKVKAAEN